VHSRARQHASKAPAPAGEPTHAARTPTSGHTPAPPLWPIKGTPSSPWNSHRPPKPPRHPLLVSRFVVRVHQRRSPRTPLYWPPAVPDDLELIPKLRLSQATEECRHSLPDNLSDSLLPLFELAGAGRAPGRPAVPGVPAPPSSYRLDEVEEEKPHRQTAPSPSPPVLSSPSPAPLLLRLRVGDFRPRKTTSVPIRYVHQCFFFFPLRTGHLSWPSINSVFGPATC
jgi:hypothetical protein